MREDLQILKILKEVIMVKINFDFLFGHKRLIVISLASYVTFAFDSSLKLL